MREIYNKVSFIFSLFLHSIKKIRVENICYNEKETIMNTDKKPNNEELMAKIQSEILRVNKLVKEVEFQRTVGVVSVAVIYTLLGVGIVLVTNQLEKAANAKGVSQQ